MQLKSDNTEFMPYDKANEIVNELFKSLLFKIPNWFRNINESEWFYFRISSTVVLKKSQ